MGITGWFRASRGPTKSQFGVMKRGSCFGHIEGAYVLPAKVGEEDASPFWLKRDVGGLVEYLTGRVFDQQLNVPIGRDHVDAVRIVA